MTTTELALLRELLELDRPQPSKTLE